VSFPNTGNFVAINQANALNTIHHLLLHNNICKMKFSIVLFSVFSLLSVAVSQSTDIDFGNFEEIDFVGGSSASSNNGNRNIDGNSQQSNELDFSELEEIDFDQKNNVQKTPVPDLGSNQQTSTQNGSSTDLDFEFEEIYFEQEDDPNNNQNQPMLDGESNQQSGNQSTDCVCGNITKVNGRFKFEVNIEAYGPISDEDIVTREATDDPGFKICQGHLISDRHLITSAHCVEGRSLIVKRGKDVDDENLFVKKQHRPRGDTNTLVLELEEPLSFDDTIGPMCLPNWNAKRGIDSDTFGYINFHEETSDHEKWSQLLGIRIKADTHYTVSKNPNCSIDGSVLAVVNGGIVYHLGVAHPNATQYCLSGQMDSSVFDRNFGHVDFFKNLLKGAQYCPSKNHIVFKNDNPALTESQSLTAEDMQQENQSGNNSTTGLFKLDCECGMEQISLRVRGGKEAQSGRYPWMVSIVSQRPCGGSLISDRHILTSARCVQGYTKDEIKVQIGITTETERLIKPGLPIEDIIIHEGFNDESKINNLALIKLKTPIDSSKPGFSHICLPNKKSTAKEFFLTGFGHTNDSKSDGMLGSKKLMEVESVPLQTSSWCRVLYGRFFTSKKICAGLCTGGSQGDGGAPLSERRDGRVFQVGITDFGYKGCETNQRRVPDVYESVYDSIEWIKTNVKSAGVCRNPDY
jgi:secreted trypsin-like serine protease